MKNLISKNTFLILVLIVASLLRFYRLGEYPALNADEAAIGYNVYSLIETGKDEHGNPWPIHFQSFNDYKPGGYFYMVLPFIYFFGLNIWSVRFISALLGVGTVIIIYLLTHEVTKEKKAALFSALLLAISPWHIHFSRGGWEVNIATFFITTAIFLFYKGIKDNRYFVFSMLSFVVSLYTYHAARVLVPFLGLGLVFINYSNLLKRENIKIFLGSVLLAGVLLVPLASNFLGEAGARASGVSIFADRGYIDRINEKRGRYGDLNSWIAKIAHNKPKEIALEFSENYFEHFWGEFLFLSGDDIERNKVPETGQLYIFQAPLLLFAFIAVFRNKNNWNIILLWLLIAPIPAALTFQSPHALRAQNMVIPLTVLSGYGLFYLLGFVSNKIKNKHTLTVFQIILGMIIFWEGLRYIHQYYIHMARSYPYSSQYGVKEMVRYVNENEYKYDNVVITTRYDQPYILYLFYSTAAGNAKYSPQNFQNNHTLTPRDEFGFSTVSTFDKFVFKSINFEDDKLNFPRSLLLGTDQEILDEANVVEEIYGANGFLYFQAVAN